MSPHPFKSNVLRDYSPKLGIHIALQAVLLAFFLVWQFPEFSFAGLFDANLWLWLAASDIGWPLTSWALLMVSLLAELCFACNHLQSKVAEMGPQVRSADIEPAIKELESARQLVLKVSSHLVLFPTALITLGSVIAATSVLQQGQPGVTFEPLIFFALFVSFVAYASIDCLSTELSIERLPLELDWVERVVDAWNKGHLRKDAVSKKIVIRAYDVLCTYFANLEDDKTEKEAELERSVHNILTELRVKFHLDK